MLIDFRQLFPKYGLTFKGVLHVGANVGEEAPIYRELGIYNQIWIEANPEIFERLKVNLAPYPDAVAFNICVGDEDTNTVLHISNNAGQSSSVLELGTHAIVHPDVHYIKHVPMPMHRIDTFFSSADMLRGYDLLNMDLQGFELQALRGMGDLINQFKAVYLEVNKAELYKGCALVEDIDFYLASVGFRRVETCWAGNTNWGDALYIK